MAKRKVRYWYDGVISIPATSKADAKKKALAIMRKTHVAIEIKKKTVRVS